MTVLFVQEWTLKCQLQVLVFGDGVKKEKKFGGAAGDRTPDLLIAKRMV